MTTPEPDRTGVRLQLHRLRALLDATTGPERMLAAGLLAYLFAALLQVFMYSTIDSWFTLGSIVLLLWLYTPVLAEGILQRENVKRMGAAMIKLNLTKPTGAPRVAEVTCVHGDHHRFVYGKGGWEAAGPAVERRPIPEEASAP